MVSIYEIKNGFLGTIDEVAEMVPAPAGWTFTPPPKMARGKPHTFSDGTTGTVQLRHERDSVNINAVTTAGTALVAAGSPDTVSFRDAEDVTHTLTGVEAVQFGLAVMQWVSAHYATAWAHKDAIKAMQTAGEDIADYDLSQGWPEGAP